MENNEKTTNYVDDVLARSTNFAERFATFIIFSQLLYVLMFIMTRLFGWFGWYGLIPWTILIIFGFGVLMMLTFLFIGVKARALSFYGSGIMYLAASIFIARWIGTDTSITDMTFLGGWSSWNVGYSVVILLIGTVRTFLLGVVHDYSD